MLYNSLAEHDIIALYVVIRGLMTYLKKFVTFKVFLRAITGCDNMI